MAEETSKASKHWLEYFTIKSKILKQPSGTLDTVVQVYALHTWEYYPQHIIFPVFKKGKQELLVLQNLIRVVKTQKWLADLIKLKILGILNS